MAGEWLNCSTYRDGFVELDDADVLFSGRLLGFDEPGGPAYADD